MKWLKKLQISLLIGIIISLMLPCTAFAEEYTYSVTLYAGNQGMFTDDVERLLEGIVVETSGDDVSVEQSSEKIVISGLHYNDRVSFYIQTIIDVSNEKYYVSGIRKGGRDNSELELSSYVVKEDKDYVVAYAIRGNMVGYTVNYQDAAGNTLMTSNSFFGNVGEKPVIAYRYVDGYRPQAYNLTKVLSANEAENVFTFVYDKLVATTGGSENNTTDEKAEETPPETTVPSEDTSDEDDRQNAPIKHVITIIKNVVVGGDGNASGDNAGGDNAGVGGGQDVGADTDTDANGEADLEEGLDSESIFDDDTPLSLLDLSEEQIPLGDMKIDVERPGTEANLLPIYAGVGVISLLALIFLFFFSRKKKKKETSEEQ